MFVFFCCFTMLLHLLLSSSTHRNEDLTCSGDRNTEYPEHGPCYRNMLVFNDGEDHTLRCSSAYSCEDINIRIEKGSSLTVHCLDTQSCKGGVISGGGSFILYSNGEDAFSYGNFECNERCSIYCNKKRSCRLIDGICDSSSRCNLYSSSSDCLSDSDIICESNTSCNCDNNWNRYCDSTHSPTSNPTSMPTICIENRDFNFEFDVPDSANNENDGYACFIMRNSCNSDLTLGVRQSEISERKPNGDSVANRQFTQFDDDDWSHSEISPDPIINVYNGNMNINGNNVYLKITRRVISIDSSLDLYNGISMDISMDGTEWPWDSRNNLLRFRFRYNFELQQFNRKDISDNSFYRYRWDNGYILEIPKNNLINNVLFENVNPDHITNVPRLVLLFNYFGDNNNWIFSNIKWYYDYNNNNNVIRRLMQ